MRAIRPGYWLFTAALCASLAWLARVNASADSFPRSFFRQWNTGHLEEAPAWCLRVDRQVADLSRGHSVLVRFTGWDFKNPEQFDFAITLFRRGNFSLCPNRLYMAIDGHFDLPPTTPQWLAEHDVRTVKWLVVSKDDRIWSATYRLNPGDPVPADPPARPAVTLPWTEDIPL